MWAASCLADIARAWAGGAGLTGLGRRSAPPDGETREQFLQIWAAALLTTMLMKRPRLFEKLHRMSTLVAFVLKYRHVLISPDRS